MNDVTSFLKSSFHAALPSSSSIGEFWPESQQFVALPHDLQRTVASHTGAIYVGSRLLLAIVDAIHPQIRNGKNSVSFEHYLPWVLDSYLALWQRFERCTVGSDNHVLHNELVALYIQVLDCVAFPASAPEGSFFRTPKAAQFLICSLTKLLDHFLASTLSDPIQIQFATTLTRLRSVLVTSSSHESAPQSRQEVAKSVILRDLESSVAAVFRDAERFSALHKDLQVCIRSPCAYLN